MFIVQCVYGARINSVIGGDGNNVLTAAEVSVIGTDENKYYITNYLQKK